MLSIEKMAIIKFEWSTELTWLKLLLYIIIKRQEARLQ